MTSLPLLIVEGDRDLRDALCVTLELAGYEVIPAAGGNEALAALWRCCVGLVISDMQMQPLDGLCLLREIKQIHPHVPVILMSAFGTVDSAVAAMRAGASDYLLKPFAPAKLLAQVERYRLHPAAEDDEGIVAADPKTRALLALAKRVAAAPGVAMDMKSLERAHIVETLLAVNGSRKLAVQRLGISERALRYKLQQYRLESGTA